MAEETKQELSVEEKVKVFDDTLKASLKDLGLTYNISLEFPNYKKLPPEVELALLVISKHETSFVFNYQEQKGDKE